MGNVFILKERKKEKKGMMFPKNKIINQGSSLAEMSDNLFYDQTKKKRKD